MVSEAVTVKEMNNERLNVPVVVSLNIGLPVKELLYGREVVTGICKKPVDGSVRLTTLGFEGDGVADLKNHGGADKAVCVYSIDHYPYWERVLGYALPPAAFGENLSVSPLREEQIFIGDTYRLGTSFVQVSQPRQPCKTLAARFGRSYMVKMVVDSGFTGFYCRVKEGGLVRRGDRLILQERSPRGVSISQVNHIYHRDRNNYPAIENILEVEALSSSWRQSLEILLKNNRL